MNFKLIFPLILASSAVMAFDKDFKIAQDRVPLEFNLLFESMKLEIKDPNEKLQFVGYCQDLDQNLGFLQKEHIFLLMKSEVIKYVLEYKFSKVRQFDMTTHLIDRLDEGFKEKEKFLNPFSQWIWRSILAELKLRRDRGLITKASFTPEIFDGAKKEEALRFQKYLTYLMPWVDQMDNLSPSNFNALSKKVSWEVLRRLNDHSILFKNFASSAASDTKVTLFNIPSRLSEMHPEEIKRIKQGGSEMTLEERGQQEKTKAQEKMDRVSPQDLSPVSDDVMKKLEEEIK